MPKRSSLFTLLFFVAVFLCAPVYAAKKQPQAYTNTRTVKRTTCVYLEEKGKWKPAKSAGDNLYRLLKKPKRGARNYEKKLTKFNKRKKTCKKQGAPDAVDFDSVPGAEKLLGESISESAVSGTAPTLSEITDTNALTTYWRDVDSANVITALRGGSPSADQCGEFFIGDSDGESGGLQACEANIDALRALVKPLEAGISACYLKNLAKQSTVDAGGISLVGKSKFPGGHVANLYSVPKSDPRIVKMQIAGEEDTQDIFVKVYDKADNDDNDRLYKVDLWFCDSEGEGDAPSGIDSITVNSDNTYAATSTGLRDGSVSMSLNGTLELVDGEFVFDEDADRTAEITFIANDEGEEGEENAEANSFVAGYDVSISAGTITLKKHEIVPTDTKKSIAKIAFSGGISDLQMTEGASKFQELVNDVVANTGSAAFEYRDTFYAVTTSSDLLSSVTGEDFSGSFYSQTPSVSLNTDGFSCSQKADVTITVNMDTESMQTISSTCESFIPQNTRFCESEAVMEAQESFETNC